MAPAAEAIRPPRLRSRPPPLAQRLCSPCRTPTASQEGNLKCNHDEIPDPSVHSWGSLTITREGSLTLIDCYLYCKSLKGLQNVFDSARARERERELLYPDACGVGGRGYKAVDLSVKEPVTLIEYSMNAVTEGNDAITTTRVVIRPENRLMVTHAHTGESVQRTFSGVAAGMDIVVSSVKAYIGALNKMIGFNERSRTKIPAERTPVSA